MTVRKLSLQLDLDAGKFTVAARDASGAVKTLKTETSSLSAALKAADSAFNGSITSARNYVASINRITSSKEGMKNAQREYIRELVRELDTLGMSSAQLREYEARQIGVTTKSKALRDAIEKKTQALEAEANAIREAKEAEELRVASANNLISRLREELILTRDGQAALEMYRAEQLGVTNEARALIQQKAALVAQQKQEADALKKSATAAREKAEADRKAAYELSQHMRTIEAMEWAIDGETASLKRKEAALRAVAAAEKSGQLTSERAMKLREYATEQHDNYIMSQKKGAGLKNHQVANLSYQVNDVISGLLMGQSPGMIAMQQGGQILQIFQQSGTGVLGVIRGLGSAFMSLAAPIAVVGAALAPVVAIMSVIARNQDTNKMLREFNAQVVLMGANVNATAPQLTETARTLDTYGTSLKNAKAELAIFLKEGVDASRMESFGKTAEHLSKVMGIEVPDAAKMTAKAFTGGWKEIVALDEATNVYSLTQLKQIKQLFDENKAAEARNLAYKIFSEQTLKAYNASMTESDRLTKALAGAWDGMISALSNTGPMVEATKAIAGLVQQLTDWINQYVAAKNLTQDGLKKEKARTTEDLFKYEAQVVEKQSAYDNFVRKNPNAGPREKALYLQQLNAAKAYRDQATRRLREVQDQINEDGKEATGDTMSPEAKGKKTWLDGLKDAGKPPKANPAQEGLAALGAEAARLQAQIDDTGTSYAKYKALLEDKTSTLSRQINGNKALAAAYLEQAKAIDVLTKKVEQKRKFDSLIDENTKAGESKESTEANLNALANLKSVQDLETARYAARQRLLASKAGAFKDENGRTAEQIAEENIKIDAQSRALQKLESDWVKLKGDKEEAQASADDLWRQINGGVDNVQSKIIAIRAQYAELIKLAPDPEKRAAIEADRDNLINSESRKIAGSAVLAMREETKRIYAEQITDSQDRARALLKIEADQRREAISLLKEGTEERKRAEEEYNEWYIARRKEVARQDPLVAWVNENSALSSKLKGKTTEWLDELTDGLAAGKGKFSDFAKDVGDQIEFLIKKALLAKYVVEPLLGVLGITEKGTMDKPDALVSGKAIGDLYKGGAGVLEKIMSSIFKGSTTTGQGGGGFDFLGTIAKGIGSFFGAYHTGGIAGQELAMMRYAHPSIFTHAPRYHTGRPIPGLSRDEMPAILKKDEGVFTKQQMKALGAAQNVNQTPNVAINIENQTGQPVDADTGGMNFDGEKWVVKTVLTNLNRPGPMRDAFRSATGK